MKKFRVTVEPEVDTLVLIIEANSSIEAEERAEEIYADGDVADYWEEEPYVDPSGTDYCRVVKVEELKDGKEKD